MLTFQALPCLTNHDVAEVLQVARTRIVALLLRRGVLADDDGSGASAVMADEALAESEPALAELAAASVTGRVPAGPELRKREPIKLRAPGEPALTKALCATEQGFSLHAATTASADDAAGRRSSLQVHLATPALAGPYPKTKGQFECPWHPSCCESSNAEKSSASAAGRRCQ